MNVWGWQCSINSCTIGQRKIVENLPVISHYLTWKATFWLIYKYIYMYIFIDNIHLSCTSTCTLLYSIKYLLFTLTSFFFLKHISTTARILVNHNRGTLQANKNKTQKPYKTNTLVLTDKDFQSSLTFKEQSFLLHFSHHNENINTTHVFVLTLWNCKTVNFSNIW